MPCWMLRRHDLNQTVSGIRAAVHCASARHFSKVLPSRLAAVRISNSGAAPERPVSEYRTMPTKTRSPNDRLPLANIHIKQAVRSVSSGRQGRDRHLRFDSANSFKLVSFHNNQPINKGKCRGRSMWMPRSGVEAQFAELCQKHLAAPSTANVSRSK